MTARWAAISARAALRSAWTCFAAWARSCRASRSEEHTSELQSQSNLVCRLLLEKKNKETHATRRAPAHAKLAHAKELDGVPVPTPITAPSRQPSSASKRSKSGQPPHHT